MLTIILIPQIKATNKQLLKCLIITLTIDFTIILTTI
jgi:hypothetical protein